MAKYSSPDLVLKFDNSGGALQTMSNYVKSIGGFAPSVETGDTTAFGDAWREHQAHLKDGGEFTLEGDYDDTAATGPDVIFNSIGSVRTCEMHWKGTATGTPVTSMEVIIMKYERKAAVGGLHGFVTTCKVTGAVTEGTNP